MVYNGFKSSFTSNKYHKICKKIHQVKIHELKYNNGMRFTFFKLTFIQKRMKGYKILS